MSLSKEDLKHIAHLARLQLDDAELDKMQRHCEAIIDFFGKLKEVNTENVEPLAHAAEKENEFRQDVEPADSRKQTDLIEAAPEKREGYVKVPPILDL